MDLVKVLSTILLEQSKYIPVFLNNYADLIVSWFSGALMMLAILAYFKLRQEQAFARGIKMSKRGKKYIEKQLIADHITEVLEDALHKGKISRERVNYWYRRIARSAGLWDLMAKDRLLIHPDLDKLKEDLKAKHTGKPKPSAKVIKLDTSKKRQPKNALDAIMHRHAL